MSYAFDRDGDSAGSVRSAKYDLCGEVLRIRMRFIGQHYCAAVVDRLLVDCQIVGADEEHECHFVGTGFVQYVFDCNS